MTKTEQEIQAEKDRAVARLQQAESLVAQGPYAGQIAFELEAIRFRVKPVNVSLSAADYEQALQNLGLFEPQIS